MSMASAPACSTTPGFCHSRPTMSQELADILHEVRAQIARGLEPDAEAFEQRVRAIEPKALPQLRRLLAVHRAKRTLGAPPPSAPPPRPRAAPPAYRAKPTIAA